MHDICFFYRASLGGPDERREQKFATLVGESFLNVTHKYFTHTFFFRFRSKQSRIWAVFCYYPLMPRLEVKDFPIDNYKARFPLTWGERAFPDL
ncbi:hypothetical protein A3Q36_11160 [Geobacillus stearothermophilus]|nr:hypothetical protein A3Q36_11160 [Geobacillus stearothermophilus]